MSEDNQTVQGHGRRVPWNQGDAHSQHAATGGGSTRSDACEPDPARLHCLPYGRHDPRITTIVLHQAYSYLLFGAEVWATKNDALHVDTLKSVAYTAARALDLPRRTSRAFMLGELVLRAPRTILLGAKVLYWAELISYSFCFSFWFAYSAFLFCSVRVSVSA